MPSGGVYHLFRLTLKNEMYLDLWIFFFSNSSFQLILGQKVKFKQSTVGLNLELSFS